MTTRSREPRLWRLHVVLDVGHRPAKASGRFYVDRGLAVAKSFGSAAPFTDPDGFAWETASTRARSV